MKKESYVIFGAGKTGLSLAKYLKKRSQNVIVVSDQFADRNSFEDLLGKENVFETDKTKNLNFNEYSVVKSPGISPQHDFLKKFNGKFLSELELLEGSFEKNVIAVTGTNGKTTTCMMLAKLFELAGKKVFLGGNIGTPLCEYDKEKFEYCVLELSSFQLEKVGRFQPDIAILLNFSSSHGERYSSDEDYFQAKLNLLSNMKKDDLVLIGPGVKEYVKESNLKIVEILKDELSFDVTASELKAKHNRLNLMFVIEVAKKYGLESYIEKLISEFKMAPYRVQEVQNSLGITIINDAKSTNWQATKTAVESYTSQKITLILGGKMRGENDSIIPHLDFFKNNVNEILLIGETSDLHEKEIANTLPCQNLGDLKAVKKYIKHNISEGVVLFSPAFPSFDQFKDYVDRGKKFTDLFD